MPTFPLPLGEKMYYEKLSRKILKSLPKRFDMKVSTIGETQELSSTKVDELISYLQTFEMSINDRSKIITKVYPLYPTLRKLKFEMTKKRAWQMI